MEGEKRYLAEEPVRSETEKPQVYTYTGYHPRDGHERKGQRGGNTLSLDEASTKNVSFFPE